MIDNHDPSGNQGSPDNTPQQPLKDGALEGKKTFPLKDPNAATEQEASSQEFQPWRRLVELLVVFRHKCSIWRRKRQKDEKARFTDWVIMVATVVIGAMAILQWLEMRSAGEQTDKIIAADGRIAAAMESSVGQAQQALAATVHQSEVAQRAWLDITVQVHFSESGLIQVGKPLYIRVVTKNVGRTPTIHTRMAIRRELVAQNSQTLTLPSFSPHKQEWVRVNDIEPDEPAFSDDILTKSLTQTDFDNFMGGKVRIFVWGGYQFDDVFGRHHWTNFCHYWLSGGAFASCPVHNGEDTEEQEGATKAPKRN